MSSEEHEQPFAELRSPPVAWWKKLLLGGAPDEAAVELQNRLATTHPTDIYPVEIRKIFQKHGIEDAEQREILKRLYRHALTCFLDDNRLTDEEARYLFALRRLFDLSEDDMIEIERDVVHPHYQQRLDEVLADELVTVEERKSLEDLRAALRVSPWMAHRLYEESASTILRRLAQKAMDDRRVSDVERLALRELAEHLGVELSLDDATLADFYRYALLWHIERGDLPLVDGISIRLHTNEVCHLEAPAQWLERPSTGKRDARSRPSARVRLTKGLYYRVGSLAPRTGPGVQMTEVDAGALYLTNRRLIFNGSHQNITLRFDGVLGVNLVDAFMEVERESGTNPHFAIDGDLDVWLVALSTLLNTA